MSTDIAADMDREDLADRVAELERWRRDVARENAILKRALFSLAGGDVEAIDDLPDALAGLGRTVQDREGRLADIEAAIPDPEAMAWDDMDKVDRVARIRRHLVDLAGKRNGKASMTAPEVDALFNGAPSTGYRYKLMNAAGYADGFDYQEREEGPNRVTVDIDRVNDQALLSRFEQ